MQRHVAWISSVVVVGWLAGQAPAEGFWGDNESIVDCQARYEAVRAVPGEVPSAFIEGFATPSYTFVPAPSKARPTVRSVPTASSNGGVCGGEMSLLDCQPRYEAVPSNPSPIPSAFVEGHSTASYDFVPAPAPVPASQWGGATGYMAQADAYQDVRARLQYQLDQADGHAGRTGATYRAQPLHVQLVPGNPTSWRITFRVQRTWNGGVSEGTRYVTLYDRAQADLIRRFIAQP